jgi:hypothetical protein
LLFLFIKDAVLKEDQSTKKWLSQLLLNLETPVTTNTNNSQQQSSSTSVVAQPSSPLGMG